MCHENMMKFKNIWVTVNEEETVLLEGISVAVLLKFRDAESQSPVWVNGKQLLPAEYPTQVLQEGDVVKILSFAAGG
jgi:thiamine biosynthesis protein ThiS